jgi:hypothetical protein
MGRGEERSTLSYGSARVEEALRVAFEEHYLGLLRLCLLAGEGGIWFRGYDPSDTGGARSIERYNDSAGEVDLSVTTPYSPIALAMGADSIWALNYGGSVTRIHLR